MQRTEAVSSEEWLEHYRPGASFFFAAPEYTLLAEGARLRLPPVSQGQTRERLVSRVAGLLEQANLIQGGTAAVVGAIPFDLEEEPHLVVPDTLRWGEPLKLAGKPVTDPALGRLCSVQPVPAPHRYTGAVERALEQMQLGGLQKVVLSRSLHISLPAAADVRQLLRNLALQNTTGYTFAADLPSSPGKNGGAAPLRTLIGASPELLVKRKGRHFTANPLAGSVARSGDPEEDRRRAEALLHSVKDRHEHALVIEAVAAALKPFCIQLHVPAEPSVIATRNMLHLSTVVTGELADAAVGSLQLAAALHPTPAVCGSPGGVAKQAIRRLEEFDRGFFTGMVGWCRADGDGEWALSIRCAEAEGKLLRLYAGAGVVEGSDPARELAETSAKLGTMLAALGLDKDILETDGGRGA